jgi:hypothetical protein
MTVDSLVSCTYLVIFGCILWVLIRLRRIPEIRAHGSIFYSFAAFVIARGIERIIKVWVDWYPDDHLWLAIRVAIAAVSIVTAVCFAFAARSITAIRQRIRQTSHAGPAGEGSRAAGLVRSRDTGKTCSA